MASEVAYFDGPLPDLPTDFGCRSIIFHLHEPIEHAGTGHKNQYESIPICLSSMNRKRPTSPEINVLAADTPGKPQRKSGAGIPVLRRSPGK